MEWKEFFKGLDEIINYSIKTKKPVSYNQALNTMYFVNKYDTMKQGIKSEYCKELNKYYLVEKK